MIRLILFTSLIFSSFILSSCGGPSLQTEKTKNVSGTTITIDENNITVSESSITCNTEVYGKACENLEDFTLVKKSEIKSEYIRAGASIGGIEGSLSNDTKSYSKCSSDGQVDCISTKTYKALNLSNHVSKIASTENIFGVEGTFVIPEPNKIFSGTPYGANGSLVGSLSYCNNNGSDCYIRSYSLGENPLKAFNYDTLKTKKSSIKNGYEITSGIVGTQPVCTVGSSNCYINGNTLKAVEPSNLIATNIKHDISLGGVVGSYAGSYSNCSSTSHTECLAIEEYPSVPLGLTSSLLSSASINGSNGEINNCSTGSTLCYIDGDTFKAAESSKLIASNIKKDVSIAGVIGNYPSNSYPLAGATNTVDLTNINFNSLIVNSENFEWFDGFGNRYIGTGDSDLIAENLRNGTRIFGVTGSYGDPIPIVGVGNNGAVALKQRNGTVVCFRGDSDYGGNCSSVVGLENVVSIYSTDRAFAALKSDGSVVTWGNSSSGGNSSSVSSLLSSGVVKVFSNRWVFAALKEDGSVVTWGYSSYGGNSSSVSSLLSSGVVNIFSTGYAFAALKSDGSVVTWGDSQFGGDSSSVSSSLTSGVTTIFSTDHAFAALKSDGSVITWGYSSSGGDSSSVSSSLTSGVTKIFSAPQVFAALKSDGSVITWGTSLHGGDSSSVSARLSSGVVNIFSTGSAFAALKEDGSVVTWGLYGGSSSSVSSSLSSGVTKIFSTQRAFAALKENGSVVTWGYSSWGGDSSSVSSSLSSGVINIFSTEGAFAALKTDGSVIVWGDSSYGGNPSSSIKTKLSSDVKNIFSSHNFFIGLKEDESYVVW